MEFGRYFKAVVLYFFLGIEIRNQFFTVNGDRIGYMIDLAAFIRAEEYLVTNDDSAICLAGAGVGRYGLLTWVPSYFMEVMGLSVKDGIFSTILLPIGHACAMFLFPLITDKVFKGKREPMLIIASVITFFGMITFPFIKSQALASGMVFVVGVSCMVTGVIWAIAGDMGGRTLSSTVVGVLDWAVYMGAAVQSALFGFVIKSYGWSAIFITIGVLYIVMLGLTLVARNMKMKDM